MARMRAIARNGGHGLTLLPLFAGRALLIIIGISRSPGSAFNGPILVVRPSAEEGVQEQWCSVLGELIAQLDRPDVANNVMTTLDSDVVRLIERRATAASMSVTDFVAGAVREFVESASDDLWFQLLTIVRKSDDPGLSAVQTILTWVVTER